MSIEHPSTEHFDVLIVGAGLSGIGAAYHLQAKCPDRTYAILEGRGTPSAAPGTSSATRGSARTPTCTRWGTRSVPGRTPRPSPTGRPSSTTSARPRRRTASIGRSGSGHRVEERVVVLGGRASGPWRCERGPSAERVRLTCAFLFMCGGYYDYDAGYTPGLPGRSSASRGASCTRRSGPTTSSTRASASS